MTTLQTINASASPEVQMNENLDAVSPSALFGRKGSTTTGLVWGYYGGILYVDGVETTIADGTVTLAASNTNYIEATRAGVVSKNIVGFTAGSIPLYTAAVAAATITSYIDVRSWREKFTRSTLTKSIAGGAGDTVLTAAEARVEHIKLTGALTGNRTVTVPNVPWNWIIDNQTSGAFTVTVRTAAGAGVAVGQGSTAVLYCDGVDVKSAITGFAGDFSVGGNLTVTGDLAINGGDLTTTATTFTAFAGATTLLTIGGTGASAVLAIPSTLEWSGTTGALTVAGGVYIAKKLKVVGAAEVAGALAVTGVLTGFSYEWVDKNTATSANGSSGQGYFMGSDAISISWGLGAPTSTPSDGSIYLRTGGGTNSAIYTRQGGAWKAVTSA